MKDPQDKEILLVGLSGAGKTNFLVALDVVLDDQKNPNGLIHADLASDRAYLQPLREKWLAGEELEHTSRQYTPTPHQLLVKSPNSNSPITIFVPDLAGETYDSYFESRSIPLEGRDRIARADGILLFLHCDDTGDHELHGDTSLSESKSTCPVGSPDSTENIIEWSIERVPKQVKIVDLLQFFSEIRTRPLRIAVVVSAWDLVEHSQSRSTAKSTPDIFVNATWPLLAQYLRTNSSKFPSKSFGVSARGGGHTVDDVERLTSFKNASERVYIVCDKDRSSDLTSPVRWLLRL